MHKKNREELERKKRDAQQREHSQRLKDLSQSIEHLSNRIKFLSEQAEKNNTGNEKLERPNSRLAIITTFSNTLIAVFTVLLWCVAFQTYDSQIKQFDLSNRPWLGVENIDVFFEKTGPNKLEGRASVSFKNAGKSPAHVIQIRNDVGVFTRLPIPPKYSKDRKQENTTIVPDGIITTISAHPRWENMSEEDFNDLQSKKSFIYFYGEVSYTDVGGERSKYTTHICVRYYLDKTMDNCDEYNDAN